MKFLLIFCLGISLLSCYSPKTQNLFIGDIEFVSFPDSNILDGKKIEISSFGANTIDVIDTFLFFTGGKLDTFYNINSKFSYRHCGNFIPKGRGDNEFPSVSFPLYCWEDSTGAFISMYDGAHGTICNLDLKVSIEKNKTEFSSKKIDVRRIPSLKFIYPIRDSLYFLHYWDRGNLNENYAYFYETENRYENIDTIYKENLHTPNNIFLLNSFPIFNASKGLYVTAMQFFDQINIYSLNNKKLNQSITTSYFPLTLKDVEQTLMPDKKEFYQDLAATDSHLFALYSGCTRKEWALNDTLKVKIHVFGWDGSPILLLKVKEKLIKIAVDEDLNVLYGLTSSEDVFRYDIGFIK